MMEREERVARAIWNVADSDGYAFKMRLSHDDAMRVAKLPPLVQVGGEQ